MIAGKTAKQLGDGTWETPGAEGIREASRIHLDRIYIERRQATMVQWVALLPLFEVCVRGTGYEGGGGGRRFGGAKRQQKKLWATL